MTAAARPSAWAALPDALTATFFTVVWIEPFAFGALSVRTALLTMLVEFILVHATGFLTVLALGDTSRTKRVLALVGASFFYLLFIAAFAWSFRGWWPFLAFLWLVVGKLIWSL